MISATSLRAAPARSRHQPSGREPMTLLPSTKTLECAVWIMRCSVSVMSQGLSETRVPHDALQGGDDTSPMTEGYAADWTVEHFREPAQRMADRIDELIQVLEDCHDRAAASCCRSISPHPLRAERERVSVWIAEESLPSTYMRPQNAGAPAELADDRRPPWNV